MSHRNFHARLPVDDEGDADLAHPLGSAAHARMPAPSSFPLPPGGEEQEKQGALHARMPALLGQRERNTALSGYSCLSPRSGHARMPAPLTSVEAAERPAVAHAAAPAPEGADQPDESAAGTLRPEPNGLGVVVMHPGVRHAWGA